MSEFIPKQYKKEPIMIRISFDKLEFIDKLAFKHDLSRSAFINQCIDFAVEHMATDEKVQNDSV